MTPISWDDTYNVWVRAHNDPGIMRWDTPPHVVSNNAGNIVDPTIEIEA